MRGIALVVATVVLSGCGLSVPGSATTSRERPTSAGKAPRGCYVRGSGLYVLPDRRCSPGKVDRAVTQANLDRTICRSGYSKSVRPPSSVTAPEKRVDLRAYGLPGSAHGYELDHVISLELGGATNSYQNYYPEKDYSGSHIGFFLNPKDHLEDTLHRLVCDGTLKLRKAQRLISTNWVAAYRHYG